MLVEDAIASFDAPHPAAAWADTITLDPLQVDCVTTLMLSILDNQCEMGLEEQIAVMAVYSVVKHRNGIALEEDVHQAIERAQLLCDQRTTDEIHQHRLQAERMIPKQIMCHFKRFLHDSYYAF
ncbi:MAG: hypothetical protein ABW096_15895 [Candidatus Thiodiazotropha sp.]